MQVVEEALDGVVLLEPTVFGDDRGSFYEAWNRRTFAELTGYDGPFVQDNHSTSARGVLRGIHYQLPNPQGKLVRCVEGEIWDVAVDLRRSSPTFGQWRAWTLTAGNRLQLWIPPGFGHGFYTLSDRAQVLYKATAFYDRDADRAMRWDDPAIGIEWPLVGEPVLSEKDARAEGISTSRCFP